MDVFNLNSMINQSICIYVYMIKIIISEDSLPKLFVILRLIFPIFFLNFNEMSMEKNFA